MKTILKLDVMGILLALGFAVLLPNAAMAHCDGMDGPVVKAAQKALAANDVNLVLVWVKKEDEQEIKEAFERTLNVRRLSPEARELADLYFFETLVRVHRAGEGAPYTGLKPAGRDLGPALPLADEALITGNINPLVKLITDEMRNGVMAKFEHAMMAQEYQVSDIEAGRDYVRAYVTFIHYVERTYEAVSQSVHGHYPEGQPAIGNHDN